MKAEIVYKNTIDNDAMIEWNDKVESGQISIMYDEKGSYIVNAEYIDIDRLLEILSKTTIPYIEEMMPNNVDDLIKEIEEEIRIFERPSADNSKKMLSIIKSIKFQLTDKNE